jgi:hypothetical protein
LRAALRYQHATAQADRAIAGALSTAVAALDAAQQADQGKTNGRS